VTVLGSGGPLRRVILPQAGWLLLVVVIGFGIFWPIVQLELRAFADGAAAFQRMLALPRICDTVRTTIILAVASSLLAVLIGTALAWCASLLPRPLRTVGQIVPLLPLLMPPIASVTGWTFLLSPRVGYLNIALRTLPGLTHLEEGPFDIYTVPWIVLITAMLLSSFVYLFVHTGLRNMGQDLEAAAAAAGASPLRCFFTITLPLLKPAILSATGIVLLLGLGQFTVPLLLGRTHGIDVLTTEMFRLTLIYPIDYGLGAALGFPILVAGLIVVLLQKVAMGEQRRYVVVSARSRNEAQETRWWAAVAVALYALVTTLLPLAALVLVSLTPFWSGQIALERLTLRHYWAVLDDPLLVLAIWTSIKASVLAVLILVAVGFACAFALLHSSNVLRPIRALIDFLVTLPLAIPAALMGFGLLFAYTGPPLPLYGTTAVLIVTYVTLMIGYATRLQFTTLVATGQEFREASQAAGAGPLRTLVKVMLPLTRKGMGATAALTFVLLFHEFSASMMVRSTKTQVIGSVMYDVWGGGIYPQVAVLALIMVAVTVVGVMASIVLVGTDALRRA